MATKPNHELQRLAREVLRDFERAKVLPVFEGRLAHTRVEVKLKKPGTGTYSGTAYPGQNRVVLRLAPDTLLADRRVVLLHELTHLVTPGHAHDEVFIARHYQACSEFFGAFFDPDWTQRRQGRQNRAYALEQLHLIPLARDWARRSAPDFPSVWHVTERRGERRVIHRFMELEKGKAFGLASNLRDRNRGGDIFNTKTGRAYVEVRV